MDSPAQITFRNLERSDAMEQRAQVRIDRLVERIPDIRSCHVLIEADHRHHHKGKLYHVRIRVVVPDAEIVVGREPHQHHAHEDAYVAIRDAFNALDRRLQAHLDKRRRDVTHHEIPPHGRVTSLDPASRSGVIMTPDGREVRFHANSLVDHEFEQLDVGNEVRFNEIGDVDGARASTVHLVGKHHLQG